MKFAEQLQELKRFKQEILKLQRKATLQEMIYTYAEYEWIKDPNNKYALHSPITLPPDIQNALLNLID